MWANQMKKKEKRKRKIITPTNHCVNLFSPFSYAAADNGSDGSFS